MSYPSVKTIMNRIHWLDKVGDPLTIAKKVRGLMDGTIDPLTIENTKKWSELHAINLLTKCHGVEYIHEGKTHIAYVNTGYTYTSTIIYDYNKQKFLVSSWGDIVERNS